MSEIGPKGYSGGASSIHSSFQGSLGEGEGEASSTPCFGESASFRHQDLAVGSREGGAVDLGGQCAEEA